MLEPFKQKALDFTSSLPALELELPNSNNSRDDKECSITSSINQTHDSIVKQALVHIKDYPMLELD